MGPKAAKKDELQQKSPAEFFADNKNIAGFDNVSAAQGAAHGAALTAAPRLQLAARLSPLACFCPISRAAGARPPACRGRHPLGRGAAGSLLCVALRESSLPPSPRATPLDRARPPPQPGKGLYTTVRELVENALDSAESISTLPEISIVM